MRSLWLFFFKQFLTKQTLKECFIFNGYNDTTEYHCYFIIQMIPQIKRSQFSSENKNTVYAFVNTAGIFFLGKMKTWKNIFKSLQLYQFFLTAKFIFLYFFKHLIERFEADTHSRANEIGDFVRWCCVVYFNW